MNDTADGSGAITLRDIAARLGLSHSTVSRALADNPAINAGTRARVRAAAEAMGYVANASARLLRGERSALVGLVIPDVQNDFYATIARIVADTLAGQGFQTVLAITEDDPAREQQALLGLVEARAAGVILTPTAQPLAGALALLPRMPVVQLLRAQRDIGADRVLIDDEEGIALATTHLLALGHRRIAYLGTPAMLSTGAARLAGFRRAFAAAGATVDERLVCQGAPRPETAQDAVLDLLRRAAPPTALLCASSELTLGALLALQSLGLRAPDDLSITGYGDPRWFALAEGGITTVQLPVEDVARAAATALLRRMSGEGDTAANGTRFRPRLAVRGSTGRALLPEQPL